LNDDICSRPTDRGYFNSGTENHTFYPALNEFQPTRSDQFQQSCEALALKNSGYNLLPIQKKRAELLRPSPLFHHQRVSVFQPFGKAASCQLNKVTTATATGAVQVDPKKPLKNPFSNIYMRRPVRVVTVSSHRTRIGLPVLPSVSCQTPMAWLLKPTFAGGIPFDKTLMAKWNQDTEFGIVQGTTAHENK
jgi:hypothetical protein